MPLLHGKSTYPGCSDFRNHLFAHARNRTELNELYPGLLDSKIFVVSDTKLQNFLHRSVRRRIKFIPNGPRFLKTINWLLTQREMQKVLKKEINADSVDIIHVASPISAYQPLLVMPRATVLAVGPLLTGPGSSTEHDQARKSLGAAAIRHGSILLNSAFRGKKKADIIFSCGDYTRSLVSNISGRKAEFVPMMQNGVSEKWFSIERNAAALQPRVVYAGRFDRWKGVDFLIDAIKSMQHPVRLDIVGRGARSRILRERAGTLLNDRIFFHEWMSHEDLNRLYAQASVFAAPSYAEAGGTALQEAMAAGIPIVATRWGGHISRLPEDCGVLVDPPKAGRESEFTDRLASAIEWVLENKEDAEARARKAKAFASNNFLWETIEPPRVYRRVSGSMIKLLFRHRSSLHRKPPLLLWA